MSKVSDQRHVYVAALSLSFLPLQPQFAAQLVKNFTDFVGQMLE